MVSVGAGEAARTGGDACVARRSRFVAAHTGDASVPSRPRRLPRPYGLVPILFVKLHNRRVRGQPAPTGGADGIGKIIMFISSHSNQKIKDIRALRQRKERTRTGLAFIEGIRIVTDAIRHPGVVETLVVATELLTSAFARELVQEQRQAGMPYLEVTAEVFRGISQKDGPQGLGAVIRQRWESLEQVRLADDFCWVALDAIQDPGNLGTILRTCDAVGCSGVILLGQSTDPYDPEALRASMGAIFSQRLVKASFDAFATWKQQHDYRVIGTSGDAQAEYTEVTYEFPLILLMGSERQGLSPEQQAICDMVISIPMVGQSDSLNLAIATGVTLYEMFRQRRTSAHFT
jgi:TrmH family RNA methyltransferase